MAIFKDLFPARHRDHGDEGTSGHDDTSMGEGRHHHRHDDERRDRRFRDHR
ncbi:hypothetical protein [Streptomyces tropicalis]|uniref:Uncharacterized protein n=1 Tax=Streptomyces tropicalis TaxID=3034234 RepID=A0ABT6A3G0_9ACTN|nr:hypothetical protein [Streptomyces tropicalis]MDF3299190.1 hypothetical protein [Streptomyces tropicalis]